MQISDSYKQYHQLLKNAAAMDLTTQDTKASSNSVVKQIVDSINQWKAGNIFAGTIQDISNSEVTIGLKSGEIIKAILNSDMALNIGDALFFQVKSSDNAKIEITPLLQEQTFNPTLLKALQAAGLSINENTLQMVQSMMEQQLPIDKASLQAMAKVVLSYENIDIPSAVELAKLNISVTPQNASMLANYKMDQGFILNQIQDFIKEIQQVYATTTSPENQNTLMGIQKDLILALFPEIKGEIEQKNGQVLPETSTSMQEAKQGDLMRSNTQAVSDKYIINESVDKTLLESIENTLKPSTPVVALDEKGYPTPRNEAVTPTLANTAQSVSKEDLIVQNQVVQSKNSMEVSLQNPVLSSLDPQEKQAFVNQFNQVLNRIYAGNVQITPEITTKDFFSLLTQVLARGINSFSDITSFLDSPSYKKVFQATLQQQWMLQPQNLNQEIQINDLYHKMQNQMNQIQQTLNNYGQGNTNLAHVAANMEQNIQFMNAVNQNYAYVQIPLKLRQQNAQAELFVYSNKRSKEKDQDEFSAFLHLPESVKLTD